MVRGEREKGGKKGEATLFGVSDTPRSQKWEKSESHFTRFLRATLCIEMVDSTYGAGGKGRSRRSKRGRSLLLKDEQLSAQLAHRGIFDDNEQVQKIRDR